MGSVIGSSKRQTHSTSSFGGITVTKCRPRKTSSILPYTCVHTNVDMNTDAHHREEFSSISV